ncbi:uncharacterized protein DUF3141 [Nitrospirillum amazonense]|uniref:Uncharacterized protein DUF3141 n=1 Tax=Nitrospirillum amazonense TaxID=28077 RepID=A0A560FQ06_9PROT|nr:DUF3141 domain-containing protein [Nitrospirillum amazonense]TWB23692.1 uncharacterized protein DUF3141 [Nitrospirillum amazonense]
MDTALAETATEHSQPGAPPLLPWLAPWASAFSLAQKAQEYVIDAGQRSLLFLDVLRQRGNDHFQHMAQPWPNVLSFQYELVMDGRTLARPVNYCLFRILPPADRPTDPRQRPFVVFDPRAGHGPGIGGMKHDSEIGVALDEGHPCYFVGFLPTPVPGQTVEDVCRAEAAFVEKVAALHPEADGKPCLIGNCQAGWQVMMMAAIRPDLTGPIVLAGSPLSYWAGVHEKNPLRYLGGLLGGTWLTTLSGDLGHGIFDGAALIANFESMNPANTLWKKNYAVYSKVDTEGERFLEFERWWGSPVLLNAEEMQYIADELFLGNRLTHGGMTMADGTKVDLRSVKSPIIVFCSWGDDITPPQQALDWILDLYDTDEALAASGQTIVYSLHQTIGHLGIFVSAKVATKEHDEFARTMDLIDILPPGLYEAVFTQKDGVAHADLVSGRYLTRFERRGLADIRALGGNDARDDSRFATVARVSDINRDLYDRTLRPLVKRLATPESAEWLRRMHPNRLRFEVFSDKNPAMLPVARLAEAARAHRQPVPPDNPFLKAQDAMSDSIVHALNTWRDLRDRATETFFLTIYGSALLQTAVGVGATAPAQVGPAQVAPAQVAPAAPPPDAATPDAVTPETAERLRQGGVPAALIRALLHVIAADPHPAADERRFAALRHLREKAPAGMRLTQAQFKALVREQSDLLYRNEAASLATLPELLPADPAQRAGLVQALHQVAEAGDPPTPAMAARLEQVAQLFLGALPPPPPSPATPSEASASRTRQPRLRAATT